MSTGSEHLENRFELHTRKNTGGAGFQKFAYSVALVVGSGGIHELRLIGETKFFEDD